MLAIVCSIALTSIIVVCLASIVRAADSDVDGDSLTIETTPVSGPTKRSVTLGTNGSFTYTPALNFVGAETFTYTLSNQAGTSTGTVTLTSPVTDGRGARFEIALPTRPPGVKLESPV